VNGYSDPLRHIRIEHFCRLNDVCVRYRYDGPWTINVLISTTSSCKLSPGQGLVVFPLRRCPWHGCVPIFTLTLMIVAPRLSLDIVGLAIDAMILPISLGHKPNPLDLWSGKDYCHLPPHIIRHPSRLYNNFSNTHTMANMKMYATYQKTKKVIEKGDVEAPR